MVKLYIIKIGGNVLDDPAALNQFLTDFAAIEAPKLLVHGGGKLAETLASQLQIPQQMHEGRRITDAETLKITTMVYAGLINKNLVASLQALQVNAIGLSGADANCIQTTKREVTTIDFGFVGDIGPHSVNAAWLTQLIQDELTPVLCAITHDGKGNLLNTNADTIASAVAIALSQQFDIQLIYCFEKDGVLMDYNDADSVIAALSYQQYQELLQKGAINKGMKPKLENAFNALHTRVNMVQIMHAKFLNQIHLHKTNAGTTLTAK